MNISIAERITFKAVKVFGVKRGKAKGRLLYLTGLFHLNPRFICTGDRSYLVVRILNDCACLFDPED